MFYCSPFIQFPGLLTDRGNQLSAGTGTTEIEETNNKLSGTDFSLCLKIKHHRLKSVPPRTKKA